MGKKEIRKAVRAPPSDRARETVAAPASDRVQTSNTKLSTSSSKKKSS